MRLYDWDALGVVIAIILALVGGLWISSACAKEISIDQLHEAIIALTESESEHYHVISNVDVYEYYSKTVGKHHE